MNAETKKELVAAAQIAGQPETEFWDEVERELDEIEAAKETVKPRDLSNSRRSDTV